MTGTRPPSRASGPPDRAQSVFDYSIGIGVFIVVVVGVLVFVPTAFASFGGSGGGPSDGLVAQRGADHLTGSVLSGQDGGSFRFGCTVLFFRSSSTHPYTALSPPDCGFQPGASLASRLSFAETQPANVTIESDIDGDSDREVLCWDSDTNPPESPSTDSDILIPAEKTDCGDASADVPLSRGSSAVENGNFAAAERYGRFNGEPVYVVVRVW